MKDEMFNTQPLPPAPSEERNGHAAPLRAETPTMMPGASPPASRAVRRGRVPRWLLVTLVGMLALAVLAGGTGLLVSLMHRQTNPPSATSAFQTGSCPFKPAEGVVVGKDVRCGYLTVPEDHSRPQAPPFGWRSQSSSPPPVLPLPTRSSISRAGLGLSCWPTHPA